MQAKGMSEASLIECRGLRKVYEGRTGSVLALDGADFEVRKGELVTIVGPSAASAT